MPQAPTEGFADVEPRVATFTQWNRKRPVQQVMWVCGPEDSLVAEVLEEISKLDLARYVYYMDTVTSEPAMWDSILTWPRGPSLALVYGAEQVRNTERVSTVLETIPELSRVVFVSREDDFARIESEDKKKTLVPHLAAIQAAKNGQLIRCCRPSNEEDLLKLVASWWPGAGSNLASFLLSRTMGDLNSAYLACKTAERAGFPPSADYLDMACQSTPVAQYAEDLLSGNRKRAASQGGLLSEAATGGVLKFLSGQLDTLRLYHAMTSAGMDAEQIARKGIPRWRQRAIASYAGSYSVDRVIRCRKLLAVAEDAFRSGVRDGVLEAVAALW